MITGGYEYDNGTLENPGWLKHTTSQYSRFNPDAIPMDTIEPPTDIARSDERKFYKAERREVPIGGTFPFSSP